MPEWGFDFLRRFEVQNDAIVVRRYMADWKFNDLITTNALHFTPAFKFSDTFEGHYFRSDHGEWHRRVVQYRSENSRGIVCIQCENQKAVVICCWTGEHVESERFWWEYGNGRNAVALETTVGHLRRALGHGFLIVSIEYREFPSEPIPKDHSLLPFFYKQRNFSWEREVRIVGEMEPGSRIGSPRRVLIDSALVFQKVVVSPFASKSYRDDVKSQVKAMSPQIPVHDSVLRNICTSDTPVDSESDSSLFSVR